MWFTACDEAGERVIRFLPSEGAKWFPTVLGDHPLDESLPRGGAVLLAGGAPMWMYAHAAVQAVRAGVARVRVFQPHEGEPVMVHPLDGPDQADPGWVRCRDGAPGNLIVEFQHVEPGNRWSPQALASLRGLGKLGEGRGMVTLTGNGPNWLYAATAALLAANDGLALAYFSPKEGRAVALTPCGGAVGPWLPADPSLLPRRDNPGRIIGVLGDPNSGKSVCSILLAHGFHAAELGEFWRLDCDFRAPTPFWYLAMPAVRGEEQANKLRDSQKRDWTPEAEGVLARNLRDCAASLDWVIADFPGGLHKPPPAQRIPPGREVLLGAADHYLIVRREDAPEVTAAWRRDLARHGLDGRVVAEVVSRAPQEAPALRLEPEERPLRVTATGLNRAHLTPDHIRAGLEQWKALARALTSACEGNRPPR